MVADYNHQDMREIFLNIGIGIYVETRGNTEAYPFVL